jgi:hypothetical protein
MSQGDRLVRFGARSKHRYNMLPQRMPEEEVRKESSIITYIKQQQQKKLAVNC